MTLGMPVALAIGVLITIIAIGAAGGFNLMFPAIASEDSGCFDAVSRSFSYVYAKPWRMLAYTFTEAVYGAVCYVFVRFFVFMVLWTTYRALQMGILGDNSKLTAIWAEPEVFDLMVSTVSAQAGWSEATAVFLVRLWNLTLLGLVVAFLVSFYFSANTVIYALMRKLVDQTAIEDIYTPAAPDQASVLGSAQGDEREPAKNDQ